MTKKSARGMSSRTTLVLPVASILALALLPWITDWMDTGHWPRSPREFITELIGSAITLVLGWWILSLIRREQREARRYLVELEQLTLTDPLTGLGNRRALERDLDLGMRRADRLGNPLALLYMDVDQFKGLNDRHGHALGDETLRVLGAVLRSNSRSGTDAAYRVGGDEFVMVLAAEAGGADLIAERVRREFRNRSPKNSNLSLGVVVWDGRMSASRLLDEADTRMYESRLPGWAQRRA
jgi:diguanylate cyclase (GGDEF)-like protein